jgi:hypothetical protein
LEWSADISWSGVQILVDISYLHSRAYPLIGSFFLGFTYCDGREWDSNRNIIFRWSFIGYFFLGFHIVTTGNVFLLLSMIQKKKNIKTLSNLFYAPSYKSDSLMVWFFFYYMYHMQCMYKKIIATVTFFTQQEVCLFVSFYAFFQQYFSHIGG